MGGLIRQVSVTRAERRLRAPIQTASGEMHVLPTVFVRFDGDDGACAVGEAPLLPGDAIDDVVHALEGSGTALRGRSAGDARGLAAGFGPPPAAWALDTGLAALDAIQRGETLSRTIVPAEARTLERVRTNALLAADTPANLAVEVERQVAAGEHTVKLKVGQGSLEHDVLRVATVREAGPALAIRLDANGAWDEDEAVRRIEAVTHLEPEYVEQPVPGADIASLSRVRAKVGVSIAADESARNAEGARLVLAARAADFLVLKPARLGAAFVTRALVREARDRGVEVVLSSLYDEASSLRASIALAAALGLEGAHGLATAALLESPDPALLARAGLLEATP